MLIPFAPQHSIKQHQCYDHIDRYYKIESSTVEYTAQVELVQVQLRKNTGSVRTPVCRGQCITQQGSNGKDKESGYTPDDVLIDIHLGGRSYFHGGNSLHHILAES